MNSKSPFDKGNDSFFFEFWDDTFLIEKLSEVWSKVSNYYDGECWIRADDCIDSYFVGYCRGIIKQLIKRGYTGLTLKLWEGREELQ